MGKASLYSHALSGTKHLISDYIEEVVHSLELIDKDDSGEISFEEKLDFSAVPAIVLAALPSC
jgi:TAG lipase/steryl ester hydrolase/phospholipase A2/LPA acyltransferase